MNDLERFLAIVRGETPDYVPIFGFPGAPGMSRGAMRKTHDRLIATGMPAWVGGCYEEHYVCRDVEGWKHYWGTTDPLGIDFGLARGARGWKHTRRVEGDFEIIEEETGAVTRQVLENDVTYSMPEFRSYHVRDRASWEFYRERATPTARMPADEMEANCRRFDRRERPLCVGAGGAYSFLRGLFGPEKCSTMLYDDPGLLHEMMDWHLARTREYSFPLIERLRPEIVAMGEDLCYNHGMLLSPRQFDEFCGPYYRAVVAAARAAGAALVAVDTDGNAMQFTEVAARYGVNAIYPYEVKAGNDLFALRRRFPDFVLFGGLEKETVNEGNEAAIAPEIRGKVPPLLAQGRYFPNGDHGIQPPVTFPNLCRFMTVLHEVCRNPEGTFPRM